MKKKCDLGCFRYLYNLSHSCTVIYPVQTQSPRTIRTTYNAPSPQLLDPLTKRHSSTPNCRSFSLPRSFSAVQLLPYPAALISPCSLSHTRRAVIADSVTYRTRLASSWSNCRCWVGLRRWGPTFRSAAPTSSRKSDSEQPPWPDFRPGIG